MRHQEILKEKFDAQVTKTWKQGNTTTYPAIKFADDLFIAIERNDAPDPEEIEEDGYIRGNIEFHVLNEEGDWAGPSCHVYMPELRSPYYAKANEDEFFKPARVSASSGGSTAEAARATALMLTVAADVADQVTEDLMPAMKRAWTKMVEARKQAQAEREAKQARIAAAHAAIHDRVNGRVVRVTEDGRKSPIVGQLLEVEGAPCITIKTNYDKEYTVVFNDIVKMEARSNLNGLYHDITGDVKNATKEV